MAEQGLEGSQPVDLTKHPSGIVPTLQWVSYKYPGFLFTGYLRFGFNVVGIPKVNDNDG